MDRNPIYDGLFKGAGQIGIPTNKDYNGDEQEGISYTQTTIFKGERMSAEVAYLKPIRSRKNLKIITNSLVTKLLFEGKTCVGVKIKNKNKIQDYFSQNEVILCGGAINSPQILELSGFSDNLFATAQPAEPAPTMI